MNPQMKSIIATLSLAFPLVLTAVGPSAEEMAFYKAYKNGAQAKECLRVVDHRQKGCRVERDAPWGTPAPLIEPYVQFSRIRLSVWDP